MTKLWATPEDKFPDIPSPPPHLTRALCLSPKGVRSFLYFSRYATDDVLSQRINGIVKFNKVGGTEKASLCTEFQHQILFPAWKARVDAIEFCAGEAAAIRNELGAAAATDAPEFDLRQDPYAKRDYVKQRTEKYENVVKMENWISTERAVEKIVCGKSVEMMSELCHFESHEAVVQQFEAYLKNA
ncbi:hypothetical protein BABINDRAFT_159846 [Babjeviella inositovora NRRL Y-12698]|uniref:Uncharacterized protein n=1 Tax=Babjeviella inositovora NRRL Y-12698 TaxID=984486 RepID=A0A1E3QWX2_9ASCO|nr:uncharacterized protein BABINDRAFT_159846 [Babjeviella inositovora NRRL Y-12698]ODQ81572.1 hypothetical protein BABINDRAFT_159846 [Babjeviella inositovora NRRL Y-12698]